MFSYLFICSVTAGFFVGWLMSFYTKKNKEQRERMKINQKIIDNNQKSCAEILDKLLSQWK